MQTEMRFTDDGIVVIATDIVAGLRYQVGSPFSSIFEAEDFMRSLTCDLVATAIATGTAIQL